MPQLAVEAVKRVDTLIGWLTIIVWMSIGGATAGAWWQSLPWQVPVIVAAIFFGYGFLRAVYQEHSAVVGVRDQEHGRLQEANAELQTRVTNLEARPRTEAEQLKYGCLQHGTKLNELVERWLEEYRKAEARAPTTSAIPDAQVEEEIQSAETEEKKQRVIEKIRREQSWDISVILNRAHREYDKNFRDRAVRLLELAEARGWAEPRWTVDARRAGKDLWSIQRVAKKLCEIGRES